MKTEDGIKSGTPATVAGQKQIVGVKFVIQGSAHTYLHDKEYSYYTDLALREGDHAVVVVHTFPKIVQVTSVRGLSENALSKASKWIVQKIDLTLHQEREQREATIREIKNRLRQRRAEMAEMSMFIEMAKYDEGVRGLLAELRGLDPNAVPAIDVVAAPAKAKPARKKKTA